jgi:hypothetical protein
VVVIDRAAHAVNFSHPYQLAQVIDNWLDGRDPSAGPGARALDTR